jgi:uncharacterized protein YigE (DUF2233 family)
MKGKRHYIGFCCLLVSAALLAGSFRDRKLDDRFLDYRVDLKKQQLAFYWKDDKNNPFKTIQALNNWLASKNRQLVFAMNGGMYKEDNSPLGLYIENKKLVTPLNKKSGYGNFYLKPNGVFYITQDSKAFVCKTEQFKQHSSISYATQSGPMLLVDGVIPAAFKKGSANLNIRNGVGVLADGSILFVMSKTPVNFFDFAEYFKNAGCKNALYLDGFVSRTYLPQKNWIQTGGNFGVIIGETVTKNK